LQDKSIHVVFSFPNSTLKVIHDLYSQCLTQTLSKTTSFTKLVALLIIVVSFDVTRMNGWKKNLNLAGPQLQYP
jgi:hypothetical protein